MVYSKLIMPIRCCQCGVTLSYAFFENEMQAERQECWHVTYYCYLCAHNVTDMLDVAGLSPNSGWSTNALYGAAPFEKETIARSIQASLRNAMLRLKRERK